MNTCKKSTILIIDDNIINRHICEDVLEDGNYAVLQAEDGDSGIQIALTHKPDLILLDIFMPDKDGFEICNELKQNELTKDIPVIFLSAYSDNEGIIKGFEHGGVDYITKPFNHAELLMRVNAHVNTKKDNDKINNQLTVIRKQKNEILEKNEELLSSIEEVVKQKEFIEGKNLDITASINYAKRIQSAVIPDNDFIINFLPDHFILFKPRDIVSGDFYWIKQIYGKIVIVAADCTGHGVAGAFMSLLGIAFLNEIMNDTDHAEDFKAGTILDSLRELVKKSLNQSIKSRERKDGMDMSVCILDLDSLKMQFAGANNPVYIIREAGIDQPGEEKYQVINENYILSQIKADYQPISVFVRERPFTNHDIQLYENDNIYMFSDGYVDQFGGEKDNKFMARNFKNLLLSIHDKPMHEQKEILEQVHNDWKGNQKQTDDILIFGFNIPESYGDVDLF